MDLAEFLPPPTTPSTWRSSASWSASTSNIAGRMAAPTAWTTTASDSPSCFGDRRWVQEIAFEEFRLRRQAGEDPSPLEYRRRFGADTLDWPSSFLDSLDE